ncbi:MAG: hypothetical protein U1D68_15900 [Arthrobacter sp.]|nr:hypothetical protein [Arthrobacter sp.]MDZ4351535.1 hypothetical protein [Arthrobacter sp.]
MTLNPILSWWVMGPLAAAIVLGLGWVLFHSRQQPAPSGDAGIRGWLVRGGLVLLLLLAACRPGIPGGTVQAAATDLNVFFVVDTSSSIAAEDHAQPGDKQARNKQPGARQERARQQRANRPACHGSTASGRTSGPSPGNSAAPAIRSSVSIPAPQCGCP